MKHISHLPTDFLKEYSELLHDFSSEAEPVEVDAVKNGYMGKFLGYVPDIPDHLKLPEEIGRDKMTHVDVTHNLVDKINEIIRYLGARSK